MSFPTRIIQDRGIYSSSKSEFKVGDKVEVGASYSEPRGTIEKLDGTRAFVRLDHKNGCSTSCWISFLYLRLYQRG